MKTHSNSFFKEDNGKNAIVHSVSWFIIALIGVTTLNGCKDTTEGPVTNNYSNEALSDPSIRPSVIFTSPANGAIGPFNTYGPYNGPLITIQFNKLVNVLNLNTDCITLRDENTTYWLQLENSGYVGSSYVYMDPALRNILIYRTSSKYLANRVYTVTIDTTFSDVHGYQLGGPYTFSFTPEPGFRIYGSTPMGNDIDPESNRYIVLDLNSKVDTTFFGRIQISPAISGRWVYTPYSTSAIDSTEVYFVSIGTLMYDTKYTVTVAGDATDANGLLISAPYQYTFGTSPFKVESWGYSSTTGPGGFTVFTSVNFYFNGAIDTSTVRSSISINPPLSFGITFGSYDSGYRTVYVNPSTQQMQRSTSYTITIDNTLRSQQGPYLKEPYSYTFTTGS